MFHKRSTRLAIDVMFLVITAIYLYFDLRDQDRAGTVFWLVSAVVWVVLTVMDLRHSPHTQPA
jgi:uncharacterized membrane protein